MSHSVADLIISHKDGLHLVVCIHCYLGFLLVTKCMPKLWTVLHLSISFEFNVCTCLLTSNHYSYIVNTTGDDI